MRVRETRSIARDRNVSAFAAGATARPLNVRTREGTAVRKPVEPRRVVGPGGELRTGGPAGLKGAGEKIDRRPVGPVGPRGKIDRGPIFREKIDKGPGGPAGKPAEKVDRGAVPTEKMNRGPVPREKIERGPGGPAEKLNHAPVIPREKVERGPAGPGGPVHRPGPVEKSH